MMYEYKPAEFHATICPTTELVLQKWACLVLKTVAALCHSFHHVHQTYTLVHCPSGFKVTTVLTLVLHLSDFNSLISSSFSRSCSLAWFSSFSIVAKSYIKTRRHFLLASHQELVNICTLNHKQ